MATTTMHGIRFNDLSVIHTGSYVLKQTDPGLVLLTLRPTRMDDGSICPHPARARGFAWQDGRKTTDIRMQITSKLRASGGSLVLLISKASVRQLAG